jgi:hypothetical protein
MSEPIIQPAELIQTGPCRIDIVEYRKHNAGGYYVVFNGVVVGRVFRHPKNWWTEGRSISERSLHGWQSYCTRGEAAGALIRSVQTDWKGVAP